MDNLQKPFARKFMTGWLLIFSLFIGWQEVYSQEQKTGALPLFKKCWEYSANQLTDQQFASDNDNKFYISLSGGKLISIDLFSGKKYWETELGGEIISVPIIDRELLYVVTKNIGIQKSPEESSAKNTVLTIRSLDKKTGLIRWNAKLADDVAIPERAYLYNFEKFLLIISDAGNLYSLDKFDARIIWTKNLPTLLSAEPLIKDEKIFLGTVDQRILSFSIDDGRLIEQWKLPASPTTFVETAGGDHLIWGDGRGSLISFNKKSKNKRWKFRNGAEISHITYTRRGLLISSLDNFIYLISETDGELLWKKRMTGRILGEPQIYGEFLITTTTDDSFASIIALNDGKLVNRITLDDENIFTGQAMQTEGLLIYATRQGILSFASKRENCAND